MNLLEVFGGRIAAGMLPQPLPAATCWFNYSEDCDVYLCNGYECYRFDCDVDYECSGYFYCPNMGGGEDFTCVADYIHSNCGGSPVHSVPCPGT